MLEDSKRGGNMNSPLTLVFVCDNPAACSAFYDDLLDTGFRVLAAQNAENAGLYSCTGPVDGVLICQGDSELGSIIGRDMKSLFPNTPVVLVSTGFGMTEPSSDLDAVCYTSSLDDEMASMLAMLFRNVFTRRPYENNNGLGELSN